MRDIRSICRFRYTCGLWSICRLWSISDLRNCYRLFRRDNGYISWPYRIYWSIQFKFKQTETIFVLNRAILFCVRIVYIAVAAFGESDCKFICCYIKRWWQHIRQTARIAYFRRTLRSERMSGYIKAFRIPAVRSPCVQRKLRNTVFLIKRCRNKAWRRRCFWVNMPEHWEIAVACFISVKHIFRAA